jgi:hypothetical protein
MKKIMQNFMNFKERKGEKEKKTKNKKKKKKSARGCVIERFLYQEIPPSASGRFLDILDPQGEIPG